MANRDVHEPKLPGVRTLKEDAVAEADDAEHLGVSFNTKSKAVPLTTPKPTQPVAGEGKAGDKALFDVGRAIDEDQLEVGSFVTDKRHKKIAFKEVAKAAFSEWWSKTSRAIKKIEAFAPAEEKPTIPKAETRKEIIQEATAHTRLAPRDDHELVVEKIKTLAHDAERVTGKSYTIKKPSTKAEATPSWSQLSETAPNQKQPSTPAPKTTPTIVSNQLSKQADHLTIAPIIAKPEHRTTVTEPPKAPSPATLPKPKPLPESSQSNNEMTVIRAPRSEPQLIATPAAPYVERPHKPGLWKILTQKKGVEHNKVTVAPPIPKPLSRLTLSESHTTGGTAEMKASEFLALFKKQQASKPIITESPKTPLPEKKPAPPVPAKETLPQATTKPVSPAPTPQPPTPPSASSPEVPKITTPTPVSVHSTPAPTPQPPAPELAKPQPVTIPTVKKVEAPPRTQPTLVIPPLVAVDVAPATVSPQHESSEWTALARDDTPPVVPAPERPVVTPLSTAPPAEVLVSPAPIIRVKTPPPASEKPKPPAPRLVLTGDKPYFEFEPEAPTVAPTPTAHVTRAISATPKATKPLWTTNRLTFALLLGVLVLVGAGAGIYTGLRHSAEEASELFAEPAEVSGFFTTDRSVAVPIASTAEEMNQTVRNEIVSAPTGITHIYGVTTSENNNRQIAVTTETMVKSLGWRLDSRFLRALEETMMIGSVANEPYIVLRSSNYDLAFAGMLGWESAMAADLATIFEITPRTNEEPFTDVLAQNHTLRVRTDTEGNETIVYTFLDRRTIIIARNQIALQTLMAAIK